jgi:hypothetical protein
MPVCAWNSRAASSHQPWSVEQIAVTCWPCAAAPPTASTIANAARTRVQARRIDMVGIPPL